MGSNVCEAILVIHPLLGCDTTSRLYSINKGVALTKFKGDLEFQRLTYIFNNLEARKQEVIEAGEKLLLKVYGAKDESTLDKLHYIRFRQKIASTMKVLSPQILPPTVHQMQPNFIHCMYTTRFKYGRENSTLILHYGTGLLKNGKLLPISMSKALAPPSLLKIYRCNCKKDCHNARCTCYKNDLRCTVMCGSV